MGSVPKSLSKPYWFYARLPMASDTQLQLQHKNIGGAALAAVEDPLPGDTLQACLASSAVLMGAVGNPAYDHYPNHLRPEAGLLRLRRELGAYANLRPAMCFPALEDSFSAARRIRSRD